MNSGSNHPSGGPGGRGRRRRRMRRGPSPAPQQGQGQGQNTGNQHERQNRDPNATQQNRRPGAGPRRNGSGRPQRGRTLNESPDAGIYSAPMDHNYRANGNGNGGRTQRPGSARHFQQAEIEAVSNGNSKPIYAFVDDLFFVAKIQETARKLNVKVEFCKPEKEVIDGIAKMDDKPSLIIFDLSSASTKPLAVITKLKAKLKKETNIIGFLSHIQGELKMKAQEAGCDMVLPRSAFSQNLPQLLRRHATADDLLQD